MREEVVITAIVRGLVDRLGRKEHRIRSTEFKSMGLDELDMTDLECAIEENLSVSLPTGIRLEETIRDIVKRSAGVKYRGLTSSHPKIEKKIPSELNAYNPETKPVISVAYQA